MRSWILGARDAVERAAEYEMYHDYGRNDESVGLRRPRLSPVKWQLYCMLGKRIPKGYRSQVWMQTYIIVVARVDSLSFGLV